MDQQFRDFVRKLDLHRNAVGLDSACLTRYETPPTLFNAARIISLMQARHSASSSAGLAGHLGEGLRARDGLEKFRKTCARLSHISVIGRVQALPCVRFVGVDD